MSDMGTKLNTVRAIVGADGLDAIADWLEALSTQQGTNQRAVGELRHLSARFREDQARDAALEDVGRAILSYITDPLPDGSSRTWDSNEDRLRGIGETALLSIREQACGRPLSALDPNAPPFSMSTLADGYRL